MRDLPSHLQRYETAAAIERLAARFDLPNESWMQDWDIEVADAGRVAEFVQEYGEPGLDDDERFALMGLILGSLDEAFRSELPCTKVQRQVDEMLRRDMRLHVAHVHYWACVESEGVSGFHITPWMRRLWGEVAPLL